MLYSIQRFVLSLMAVPNNLQPVGMWDVKMRKRLALLQSLAVLMAVFQYGQRATGQEKGGDSNRILSNFFLPSLTAR